MMASYTELLSRVKMQHLFCQHCRAIQKVMGVQAECWYNPLDREAPAFCASNEDAITEFGSQLANDQKGEDVFRDMREALKHTVIALVNRLDDTDNLTQQEELLLVEVKQALSKAGK